jgi:glycosyltransferase involved in cell wall biosynthesis
MRYGGGSCSGTDTSVILIAEYLSKFGNQIVVATDDLEPELKDEYRKSEINYDYGYHYNGVSYTNLNFDGISNKKFDILISMLWFENYDVLPISVSNSLIYWSHMQWIYGIDSIVNYVKKHNLNLGIVHISDWEKKMTGNVSRTIQENLGEESVKIETIPNPIMDEIIDEVLKEKPIKKNRKFIFHASWARGGDIAYSAIDKLNYEDKEFHAFDYLITIPSNDAKFFNKHDGVDKKTLFKHLAESEYFIYPLYTPYQDVHKDTFSCVVAEAISLGVTVITYPLGALYDNYKDYCQWLQLPVGFDLETVQNEPLTKDLDGKFKIDENIVHMIHYLEQNPQAKNLVKDNGYNYITSKYKLETIGNMWLNYIENLCKH